MAADLAAGWWPVCASMPRCLTVNGAPTDTARLKKRTRFAPHRLHGPGRSAVDGAHPTHALDATQARIPPERHARMVSPTYADYTDHTSCLPLHGCVEMQPSCKHQVAMISPLADSQKKRASTSRPRRRIPDRAATESPSRHATILPDGPEAHLRMRAEATRRGIHETLKARHWPALTCPTTVLLTSRRSRQPQR